VNVICVTFGGRFFFSGDTGDVPEIRALTEME
jgi:hypothetical protein